MPFHTILRYLIDPHFEAPERIEELAVFCRASRIDEVMLFITPEELSAGHPTADELRDCAALGKALRKRLEAEGVALSLNPWSTIYHNFRGRTLREGQDFRRMVGETGAVNPVAVCPLCAKWQHYLCESFSMLAREIRPVTLWVEDDWRLRNHDAALGWGGCFCEAHLERFARRVGEPVERKALVEAITQPGPPHPWRAEWLDLSCETLLEPLTQLAAAIEAASPQTRLALMSSSPDAHSSEGRKWKRFQDTVRGKNPVFLSRPNMAPYTQVTALQAPPSLTRLTIANLSGAIEVYPELENSPRCGPYSKSGRYSVWQMFNCAAIGSRGVTINHYDMLGNGIALDRKFGSALREAKARLDALAADPVDDRLSGGVEILFSPEVSRHFHTAAAGSLSHLMQESYLWGDTCFILGIAHRYVSAIELEGAPVLVSGQTLRAFPDEALRRLFARQVVLDAESAAIALERGFGGLIGLESAQWALLRECAYAYEEILEDDPSIHGVRNPRLTAQRCSNRLLAMECGEKGARALSVIRRGDHHPLWPGCVRFENRLGGTVVSLAYPVAREAQYFMAFFNVFRRTFLQRLLFDLGPKAPLAMAPCHPLHCHRHPVPGGFRLSVFNPTDDPAESVTIDLPAGEARGGEWLALDENARWTSITPRLREGTLCDRFEFAAPLGYLDGLFLKYRDA